MVQETELFVFRMIKDLGLQMGMSPMLCPSGQSQQGRAWRSLTAFHRIIGAVYAGRPCQTSGWGCQIVAGVAQTHTGTRSLLGVQRVWGPQSFHAWPQACSREEAHLCSLCELNKQQQPFCVTPSGLSCFPWFRWSHFKILPVLQTQTLRFCSGLLQDGFPASPLVSPCFIFTSCAQGCSP